MEMGSQYYSMRLPPSHFLSQIPNSALMIWERTVTSKFDEQLDIFVPCPEHKEWERYVVIWLPVAAFVELDSPLLLITEIKKEWPGKRLLLVLQGLSSYISARWKHLQMHHQVLSDSGIATPEDSSYNIHGIPLNYKRLKQMDEIVIDKLLVELQIDHSALVLCTKDDQETGEWLARMTLDVSSIPYK